MRPQVGRLTSSFDGGAGRDGSGPPRFVVRFVRMTRSCGFA